MLQPLDSAFQDLQISRQALAHVCHPPFQQAFKHGRGLLQRAQQSSRPPDLVLQVRLQYTGIGKRVVEMIEKRKEGSFRRRLLLKWLAMILLRSSRTSRWRPGRPVQERPISTGFVVRHRAG